MTINQIANKVQDFKAYFGAKLFEETKNKYEYFSVKKYFENGHYSIILKIDNLSETNRVNCSLIKLFNFFIYTWYSEKDIFHRKKKLLNELLQEIETKNSSRHHIKIGNSIYIKNDYEFNRMNKGWIGGLPHLRLICLLEILVDEYEEYKIYNNLLEKLVHSIIEKNDGGRDNYSYKFINPICSYDQKRGYCIHEYPEKKSGPNWVVNCDLLFCALIMDLSLQQKWSKKFSNIIPNKLKYYDEKSKSLLQYYSFDERNPLTPAYFQLQSSIIMSSGLKQLDSKFVKRFMKNQNSIEKIIFLFAKVVFRTIRGYK